MRNRQINPVQVMLISFIAVVALTLIICLAETSAAVRFLLVALDTLACLVFTFTPALYERTEKTQATVTKLSKETEKQAA